MFVRWKSLEKQPIGWHDLNDGVRLNIRPFMTNSPAAEPEPDPSLKPNVHWKKDRGKDVVSAPSTSSAWNTKARKATASTTTTSRRKNKVPETQVPQRSRRQAEAGSYNRQVPPPAVILWPDEERQWEGLILRLRENAHFLTYGDYDKDNPDWTRHLAQVYDRPFLARSRLG